VPGSRARLAKRLATGALAFVVFVVVGLFAFGWWQFSRIPRVDVAAVLSPAAGAGTNYLIVGTDSREGIVADDPNAGAFLGPGAPGGESTRTDTIMVMRVEQARTLLLSIPRDLWVKNPKTGEFGRINSVFQSGPDQLIRAVQGLGIPVQHYLEINFVSFAKLVDAVGGIDVEFAHPTRDQNSGLLVETPGVNRLDGVQGLAYVRSRHYEELVDGRWREDPTADLGRVQRQQTFLKALMAKATNTKNPLTAMSIATSVSAGLRIDNTLSYFEALGLAWRLRSFNPEPRTLPTKGRTTSGGAAVLDLQPDAAVVIAEMSA
jgi:LCP family protein required for cell wall assembly